MPNKRGKLEVICPSCQSTLIVDSRTGLVLNSRGHASGYSFETALEEEKTRKAKSDELFDQAFQEEQRRRKGLEEKFKEALKSKDELDDPRRPFDFD